MGDMDVVKAVESLQETVAVLVDRLDHVIHLLENVQGELGAIARNTKK